MAKLIVGLTTEVLSVEPGHWCRRCGLPSGVVAQAVAILSVNDREPELQFHQVARCTECGKGDDVELRSEG